MSMILTAYNVIKPLPPEGSDEWLAMLPGWTGWRYDYNGNGNFVVWNYRLNYVEDLYWDYRTILGAALSGAFAAECHNTNSKVQAIGTRWAITVLCEDVTPKYFFAGDVMRTFSNGMDYRKIASADVISL